MASHSMCVGLLMKRLVDNAPKGHTLASFEKLGTSILTLEKAHNEASLHDTGKSWRDFA